MKTTKVCKISYNLQNIRVSLSSPSSIFNLTKTIFKFYYVYLYTIMKIAKVCKIVTMSKISCTWDKILHVHVYVQSFFYFLIILSTPIRVLTAFLVEPRLH